MAEWLKAHDSKSCGRANVSEVRILSLPPFFLAGLGAAVARTPGGREVASSSLVSQTISFRISGCGAVGSAQRSGR